MRVPIIEVSHLTKTYKMDHVETKALVDVTFSVMSGEFVAIMGPSGSGKSTLMQIIGALDKPTSGGYHLHGVDLESLTDDELAEVRNKKIGFIFQSFNLLPRTTALKNVVLPMIYAGFSARERRARAEKILKMVGLSDRLYHTPNQLSGGQQQRVAIARGLALNPMLILADEPTGNIASTQAEEIMGIFQRINDLGHTIVMITHEMDVAMHAKRILHLYDGRIVSDKVNKKRKRTTCDLEEFDL